MFYSFKDGFLFINVRATTKASNNSIRGQKNDELLINVTSAPENNKANSAIIKLLSEKIGIAKSSMTLVSGSKCRNKRISIDLSDRKQEEITAIQKILNNLVDIPVSKESLSC